MGNRDLDSKILIGSCDTSQCSHNASNLCKTHRLKLCTVCSIVFHYDCDLKIANCIEFGDTAIEILNDVVKKLSFEGMKLQVDRYCIEYNDEVKMIAEKVKGLHKRNRGKNIDIFNEDDYVKDCIKVVKNVLESQAYKEFIDYNSRVGICCQISNKIERDDELSKKNIRDEFSLIKGSRNHILLQKHQNFISERLIKDFNQLNNKCSNMFESTKITISDLSETIQSQLLESDKLSNSLYEKLEKDSKTQYKVLKEQIKMQQLEYCELEKSNRQQYDDLSKKLLEIYDRLNDLNNSQKKQIKANKHLSNQYQYNDTLSNKAKGANIKDRASVIKEDQFEETKQSHIIEEDSYCMSNSSFQENSLDSENFNDPYLNLDDKFSCQGTILIILKLK